MAWTTQAITTYIKSVMFPWNLLNHISEEKQSTTLRITEEQVHQVFVTLL